MREKKYNAKSNINHNNLLLIYVFVVYNSAKIYLGVLRTYYTKDNLKLFISYCINIFVL